MLTDNMDYFRQKPSDLEKTTIMLDHGYHPETIQAALEQVYPEIITKIQFEVAAKLSLIRQSSDSENQDLCRLRCDG